MPNYNWFEPAYRKKVIAHMEKNMTAAAIFLVRDIKEKFPDSGTPEATKAERRANPSKPGEIPHVQEGYLKNNIGYSKPRELVRRIGTGIGGKKSVGYAAYLEFGTPNGQMKARPYLRPALYRNRDVLNRIIGKPM